MPPNPNTKSTCCGSSRNKLVIPEQVAKRRQCLKELRDRRATPPTNQRVPAVTKEETIVDIIPKLEFKIADSDNHESTDTEVPRSTVANASRRPDKRWRKLIPSLLEPYLRYVTETNGDPIAPPSTDVSTCTPNCTIQMSYELMCLYFDCCRTITVHTCPHHPLTEVLIRRGLFPSTPSQPRMAISIELLMFYRALLERSRDTVTALASALHTHYLRRGFHVISRQGRAVKEPFRRSLGPAVKWFEVLQVAMEHHVDAAPVEPCAELPDANQMDVNRYRRANSPSPSTPPTTPPRLARSDSQEVPQRMKHRLVKKNMTIQHTGEKGSMQSTPSANLSVTDNGRGRRPNVTSSRDASSVEVASGDEATSIATVIPERVVSPQQVPSVESSPNGPIHCSVPVCEPPQTAGVTVPMERDARPGHPEAAMLLYNERPIMGNGWYGPVYGYPGPNFHSMAHGPYPQSAHYANINNAQMAGGMHPQYPYLPPPDPASMHNAFVCGRLVSDVNTGAVEQRSPQGVVEARKEGPSHRG